MIFPKIKIEGRSGCKIEILEKHQSYFIRKTSNSLKYNDRLKKQCQKQTEYINIGNITTPSILNCETNTDGLFFFEMPYIMGEKYSDYLVKADIIKLNRFIDSLLQFIDSNLFSTVSINIKNDLIINKVLSVEATSKKKTIQYPNLKREFNFLLNNIPQSSIPMGKCHGDLTLSNVIISNNSIYIIDFLDSFIESPVMDIVKLRQDTKFKWSLILEKTVPAYQKNKITQALNYFDKRIVKHFEHNQAVTTWYNFLEKFNLLRVLPYLENKEEEEFIINALEKTQQ